MAELEVTTVAPAICRNRHPRHAAAQSQKATSACQVCFVS
jgi:hypothetical protein